VNSTSIDWAALRSAAITAMGRAYAPYSKFPVGAAALVDDGRLVVGCNVENASYGLGLCAECGLVSSLQVTGGGRLVALACVDADGRPLMPCGRCRQLLWEHGGAALLIDHASGPLPMTALLPHAFDDADLDRIAGERDRQPTVPAALALKVGSGTVFVHPEIVGARQVWTSYWERSSGTGDDEPAGILEEGPTWETAAEAVNWGRIRTPRVVVVDAQGVASWAGDTPRPAGIEQNWSS
jgi:cytidine deaminase